MATEQKFKLGDLVEVSYPTGRGNGRRWRRTRVDGIADTCVRVFIRQTTNSGIAWCCPIGLARHIGEAKHITRI